MTTETDPPPIFRVDKAACKAGGTRAGAYLEKIGKTDLAQMNEAQWDHFCMVMVAGALWHSMEAYVDDGSRPPF